MGILEESCKDPGRRSRKDGRISLKHLPLKETEFTKNLEEKMKTKKKKKKSRDPD